MNSDYFMNKLLTEIAIKNNPYSEYKILKLIKKQY